mgnify:CR=1 FL=1
MFEENNSGFDDQSIAEGDQTPPTKEIDLPDEGEALAQEPKKVDKAEVAQKIKWREKYLKAQEKIRQLEDKQEAKEQKGQSTQVEEKELAAQRYIQDQARKAIESWETEKKLKEEKAQEDLQVKLDMAVEDSGFTEDEIVQVCDEYEVEPEIAVKILTKVNEKKSGKPNLPSTRKGTAEIAKSEAKDDSKKTIYEIAQEIKRSLKS